MNRFRDPNFVLLIVFLAIIAIVPAIQTVREAGEENGIAALELFGQPPTAENLRAFEKNLEKANWAADLSRHTLQYAHFTWLKEGGYKAVFGLSNWFFYRPGLSYMTARSEEQRSRQTNDPVAAIVDFRDQLAAQGIHLLLMPVPNKESIYPDLVSSRAAKLRGVIAPRTGEMLQRLRAAKVEVIDLFQDFGEARKQSGATPEVPLYLAQDTHWSPAGVSLAAKAVARRLTELGWTPPGAVEYQERAAPVQRLGDIVRMLQVPAIERSVPPESVAAVQVVRADKNQQDQPYNDEASAEILVLGDSFMRIYQRDEPTSAGFIAHLAKELKQPMMSLINDGGGATLVREELRAQPAFLKNKRVVIWEFVERDFGLAVQGWPLVRLPEVKRDETGDRASETNGRARPLESLCFLREPRHIVGLP